ncbi:MAG: hypothetical protein ACE5HJ_04810 [Thermoplasmata archaeon]
MVQKILEGVPGLSFAKGERFSSIGALKAVATFLGADVSYSWLMGISGAAFRICWSDNWSMEMTYSAPEDVVANGGKWLGLRCTSLLNPSPEDAWERIRDSIDSSIPVLSCGLAGAPEFCLIYGYAEEPRRLFVRSYFLEEGEGEIPFQPWMGWNYSGYGRMPLVLLDRREREVETMAEESLQRALQFSKGEGPLAADAENRGLHFGIQAYDAWIEALKEVEGDLEAMAFNMALNLNALLDARRTAGEYLQILAAMKEEWRKSLMRASDHYRHQVSVLGEARRVLYFPLEIPEKAASKAAARLADVRPRKDYSIFLRAARDEELLSLEWIAKALEER